MNKMDIVKAVFDWQNEGSAEHLSDNLQATDEVGSPPIDKTGWVGMGQMFRASIPDLQSVIEDIREEGEVVVVKSHSTGTFTNDLDMSAMGMGAIPATGGTVTLPSATLRISFEGDKVVGVHNTETGPDAGLPGMLKALGAEMG